MKILQKYKKGDIYYASLQGKGSEQQGYRPVLIIQNDTGNRFAPTLIVCPITSRTKNDLPTHVKVGTDILNKESIILTEQILTIDKSRIMGDKVGCLNKESLEEVEKAVKISLNIT